MIEKLRRYGPQALRHLVQLSVILFVVWAAFGTTWRNYKRAHNSSRLVGLLHGDGWGTAYAWNEDLLSLVDEDTAEASARFLGFPWAARVFGLETADPLLAASNALSTGALSASLLLSLLAPLLLALLFGKAFCSHLCPMRALFELGELVRAGLLRLRVPLPEARPETRLGGWVLLGGLLASWVSTTGVWILVLPYVSLSAGIFLLVTTGAFSAVFGVVALWWLIDVAVAPGLWCYNLCPTGFLLEQVGRFSLVALRKKGDDPCAKGCDLCERACPYALSPKDRTHRPACDSCGRCAAVCPTDRLVRRLPVIGALLLAVVAAPSVASAHHNKGLPHYGYFANYPQVPTEEYVAIDGRWEIGATIFNFQGYDGRRTSSTPNDVKIYLYLYDVEADASYSGPVDIVIRRDGEIVARYDRTEPDEESVYSTRETLPESGDYELVALVDGREVVLDFHVDLDDGPSMVLVLAIVVPVLLVFGLALFGRKRRRRGRRGARAAASVGLAVLALPTLARAQEELGCATGDGSRQVLTDDGPIQVMSGLPPWLFVSGVVLVLVLSFAATEWVAPRLSRASWRVNLLRRRRIYGIARSRWVQTIPQLAMVGVLAALVVIGLTGSRVANLTPTVVWTIWWAGLIFAVLFLGSAWCFACPWDGLASLASRLRLAARVEPISLGLRVPRWLASLWPAIVLFALLTWLELGWGVTTDPRATAIMGLGMAALAVIGALLFDGKKFCQHACPVGRICGIYSTFAPIEIRARNKRVCARCTTEDCLNGNERGYACPTGISLKVIKDSADCTMCGECIRSCDKRNVALNLRPFAADLRPDAKPRLDQAWLAVILLSLTLFHGLSMTSAWESFEPGSTSVLRWIGLTLGTSRVTSFTIAMVVACAVPVGLYVAACRLGARWSGGAWRELFVRYSFSLLPVALFYHLAHNLMHLLTEGGHVVPLLSDPLGRGDDLLGTAAVRVGALISDDALWTTQVVLVLIGHVFGIVAAHRVGHRLFDDPARARRSLLPIFGLMVLVSAAGLGLMHLDMNMRLGRM